MDDTFSKNAADLLKIAIGVAGFDKDEIKQRTMRHRGKVNVGTVERWLQEMSDAQRGIVRAV